MSRHPELHPAWLVDLLRQWALRDLFDQNRGRGWYSESPMLKDGIRSPARSYTPEGFGAQDFKELTAAMSKLEAKYLMAVIRYVKPWQAKEIDAQWGLSTAVWLRSLKAGLKSLEHLMAVDRV